MACLASLSEELTVNIFRGSLLKGREVCKEIRNNLWRSGTNYEPLFLRLACHTCNGKDIAFLESFRSVTVLIPFEKESPESIHAISVCKDLSIDTLQELTASDIRTASETSRTSIFDTISCLISLTNIPLPRCDVLSDILDKNT